MPDQPDTLDEFRTEIRGEFTAIRLVLNKHATVIDSIIEERDSRRAFWDAVRTHLVSNGIWGLLAVIAYVLWYAAQTYIASKHG